MITNGTDPAIHLLLLQNISLVQNPFVSPILSNKTISVIAKKWSLLKNLHFDADEYIRKLLMTSEDLRFKLFLRCF